MCFKETQALRLLCNTEGARVCDNRAEKCVLKNARTSVFVRNTWGSALVISAVELRDARDERSQAERRF